MRLKRLQFTNGSIWFDRFIKSVMRLLGEYGYFFVNSQLRVVTYLQEALKYRLGHNPSIILIMQLSTV